MQNVSSIRIKPIHSIRRNCLTINRLHEVVLTMPNPIIFFENKGNYLCILAHNYNGVCVYKYESFHYSPFSTSLIHQEMLTDLYNLSLRSK